MEKKPKQRIIEKAEYIPPWRNRNEWWQYFCQGRKKASKEKKSNVKITYKTNVLNKMVFAVLFYVMLGLNLA